MGKTSTVSPRVHQRLEIEVIPVGFRQLCFCSLLVMILVTVCIAQTPKIEITDPKDVSKPIPTQTAVRIAFKVTGASQKRIRVSLVAGPNAVTSDEIAFSSDGEHVISVNVFKGRNTITLIGFVNDAPSTNLANPIMATCDGRWCKEDFSLKPDSVASEFKESSGPAPGSSPGPVGGSTPPQQIGKTQGSDQKGAIHIESPDPGVTNHYQNAVVPFKIKVDPNADISKNVKSVYVRVLNGQKPVPQKPQETSVSFSDPKQAAELTANVTLADGSNDVTVFESGNYDTQRASIQVVCDKCGSVAETAEAAPAQKGSIHINAPKKDDDTYVDAKTVPLGFTVDQNSSVRNVSVEVLNKGAKVAQTQDTFIVGDVTSKAWQRGVDLRILEGLNKVTVSDKDHKDGDKDYTEINCNGPSCGGNIKLLFPENGADAQGHSSIDAQVLVAQNSGINSIRYRVVNGDKTSGASAIREVGDISQGPKKLTMRVPVISGTNVITFYDAADGNNQVALTVQCAEDTCASDFGVATIPTNSQNTRIVVGLEQVGASSTSSETKPFLDFFFTTPFLFNTAKRQPTVALEPDGQVKLGSDGKPVINPGTVILGGNGKPIRVPRAGFWGQVRLAATPEQLTNIGVLPTNLIGQLGQNTTSNNLIQSFDFLAGMEGRLFTANGSFLSLIPGIRQKTRFFVAGGFGAISPLTATKENVQIFKIPDVNSPQYQTFIDRYGTPPVTPAKQFVAFVPLDRDRFLRQWYAGLRLKTYFCDRSSDLDPDCVQFRNSFPAIVDFMFGQSESVTGGSLKYSVPDPTDKTKILRKKNAFVFKIDAFYPMPFREASFIYVYGTAIMKIGGGGVTVNNPLLLDPGTALINDTSVYIPPVQLQRYLQPNRDYYKIGVGVNLTDLFNKNKTPPQ